MADPQIEKLLIVQDRDASLQKTEQELARLPRERAALDAKIDAETQNIEAARSALKAKELARKELDSEVKTQEAAIQKFRTLQLEVKKNDEYRALTQQIEQAEATVATLEEKEIHLLLEIDSEQEAFDTAKAEIEARIEIQKHSITQLQERETNLKATVDEARASLDEARAGADPEYLQHYDRVRKLSKRPPYVARVENHTCSGCHLRVSNEVAQAVREPGQAHFCDQCGRLVYL
jgi:predicted  nucleic acid-binding Zn-ribbon protein